MLDFVRKTHKPIRPQYAPNFWSVPAYGKRLQMEPNPDESYIIDQKSTKRIQSIVGTILFYARSVDPTMLREINEILWVQSRSTRKTAEKAEMLLDYPAT